MIARLYKNNQPAHFPGRDGFEEFPWPVEASAVTVQSEFHKPSGPTGINRTKLSSKTSMHMQTEMMRSATASTSTQAVNHNVILDYLAQDEIENSERHLKSDLDSIQCVNQDLNKSHSNIIAKNTTEATTPTNNGGTEDWSDDQFERRIQEAFPEAIKGRPSARAMQAGFPPRSTTNSLRASLEAARAIYDIAAEGKGEPRRRGTNRKKRVASALRAVVESDPRYQHKSEIVNEMKRLFDEAIAASNQSKIRTTHNSLIDTIRDREDFHLINLGSIADKIERCGQYGAFACGSYWCSNCKMRFGARLTEDTQAQLGQRYGNDLENARSNLLHITILSDLVIPDPDIDRDLLADFSASIVRRDHLDIMKHLMRLQDDRRSAMSARLIKLGLNLELAEDWIGPQDRDRRFYDPNNLIADTARLLAWNDVIAQAHDHFRSQSRRKRPDLESPILISCRDEDRFENYLWQLRKAQPLDREDILNLAQGFQLIAREFRGITKTNYPEKLKFKSSIEKVIKRERRKLYRLGKDLPGISLIGAFEMELVDLRHAIGGDHQHSVKAITLRTLASQPRKPTKQRKAEGPISFETQRRRQNTGFKMRLLDDLRERIASNKDLPDADFPGLHYAVHLHMHVLVDLNGKNREDLERWLTGRAVGSRGFRGQWKLPYQVMIKSLFENKAVEASLRNISFYPIKGPLAFNYENTSPKDDEECLPADAANFSDEALALIAWLQHGIGHESLRVAIDWPGVDRERRGRKPASSATPKMTDDELQAALAERGVALPSDPIGETDISFLFELRETASQGDSLPREAFLAPDQEREKPAINDTAPSPTAPDNEEI